MSLSGYFNNGLNQSLNGILSITDGSGVEISNGQITADTINVNNFSSTYITGELETSSQPNITSIGTLTSLNVSGSSVLSGLLTIGNGIYTGSNTISNNVLGFISTLSSNAQTQFNNLSSLISTNTSNIATNTSNIATNTSNIATNTSNIATNTSNIATNTSNISSILSRITQISYNSSLLTTSIANILQLTTLYVSGNTSLSGSLNTQAITLASDNNLSISGTGIINQSSSGTNLLSNTKITGILTQIGNIVQTSGSNTLLASTIGTITQANSDIITQSGTGTNNLKNSTISNLTVSTSITLPSNITIPGATYNSNTNYTGTAIISQAGTGTNLLKSTEFTGAVQLDSNITQSTGGTASFQATTITGQLSQAGSIVQSTGSNTFLVSAFSGLITANGGINIPSGQLLTLLGSLYVNGTTITPVILSYLSGVSSNIQTQIGTLTSSLATTNSNISAIQSTLTNISYSSGTTSISGLLALTGSGLFVNSLTISPTVLGYLSGTSSNIQSQFAYIYNLLQNCSYNSTTSTTIFGLNFQTTTLNTDALNISGTATLASTGNLTLNGNIYANSLIISPIEVSYLDGLTSNIQTQISSLPSSSTVSTLSTKCTNISYNSSTNTTTISGTLALSQEIDSGTLTVSGTSSLAAVSISGLLTLSNSIFVNSATVSQAALSYVANLSSDCQAQLTTLQTKTTNISYSTFTLISGTCQTTVLNCNGATTFKAATSLAAGQTFTFLGNISANSNTITPTQLGYISGLTGNAETRLATLETKTTNLYYNAPTNLTTILSNVLFQSGTNNFPTASTGSLSGMAIFWSSVSSVGETNLLNYSGSLAGGFIFSNSSNSNSPSTLLKIDSSGNTTPSGNVVLSSTKYIDITNCTGIKTSSTTYINATNLFNLNQLSFDGSYNITLPSNLVVNSAKYIDLTSCTTTSSGLKIGSSTYLNATQLSTLSSVSSLPITYSSPDTTINSNIKVNGLIKTSTTALTYTSDSTGYTTSVSNSTDFTIVASAYVFANTSSLTLGIGVWLLLGTDIIDLVAIFIITFTIINRIVIVKILVAFINC